MKINKSNLSVKKVMIISFIITMIISISGLGYLAFSRWLNSAKVMTTSISEDITVTIHHQIEQYLHNAWHVNEHNQKLIEKGVVDLNDDKDRDMFFVSVISSQEEGIYSFSYGSVNGEYYGARRSPDGVIEIMRNDETTGGNSWYYSINEDYTANELVVQAGKFDPRTRLWYQIAAESGEPSFSPIYKHFVIDDLAVSAAWPIYDDNDELLGVLGVHMLLDDIGGFLEETISKYEGYALIYEKESGALIANSTNLANFTIMEDKALVRNNISDIDNQDIHAVYDEYVLKQESSFILNNSNHDLVVNADDFSMAGLDWIILTIIPDQYYMSNVIESVELTIMLVLLIMIAAIVIYGLIIDKMLRPLNDLKKASIAFASGDLKQRVKIVRNDEIGNIASAFNILASQIEGLITGLEANVEQRTKELNQTNLALATSKDELKLILDTAAEAIYGIDLLGNCTFCNKSGLQLLGYQTQADLLGKNMHQLIHHSYPDGRLLKVDDCKIYQTMKQGEGVVVDDEVFFRADGTSFAVEYRSYPQTKDNRIIGAVITFFDITKRKQKEAEVIYLSCHDTLTGLKNRRCFEDSLKEIDQPANLPITLLFGDINGLKMTNDIFGHTAGDELIKQAAQTLQKASGKDNIVSRVGGDEFIIIMPKTDRQDAKKILEKIKDGFTNAKKTTINCSISLGFDTKETDQQSIEEVMANAENAMYKDKTINRKKINKDIINTIIESLHTNDTKEKQHSFGTQRLSEKLGKALDLAETDISKLKEAAYLHDIGKITIDRALLMKKTLNDQEYALMQQHPVVGYRILNLFDDTLDLAEYVYYHHERWDGKGYPIGLKGKQIPLIARIIAIAETFDRIVDSEVDPSSEKIDYALGIISSGAGKQFDPELAKLFCELF